MPATSPFNAMSTAATPMAQSAQKPIGPSAGFNPMAKQRQFKQPKPPAGSKGPRQMSQGMQSRIKPQEIIKPIPQQLPAPVNNMIPAEPIIQESAVPQVRPIPAMEATPIGPSQVPQLPPDAMPQSPVPQDDPRNAFIQMGRQPIPEIRQMQATPAAEGLRNRRGRGLGPSFV